MFATRQPRKYRPVRIYTDESKDKLQKIVDDVKREQGLLPQEEKPYDPTKFKGTFSEFTPRAKNYKENGSLVSWPLVLLIIPVLLVIMRYLLTGAR